MCVICGNVADTSTTAATVSAFLLSISPLLGLYFYRLYRLLAISQQMRKPHSHWRVGALLGLYNSVLYIVFGLLFYVLIQYIQDWFTAVLIPTAVFLLFWTWLFRALLQPRYAVRLFQLLVIALCGGSVFILPLVFSSMALTSSTDSQYYIHYTFLLYGVLYSIMLYSLLLLVACSSRFLSRYIK